MSGAFVPIAERLIGWHARYGRKHLPWQRDCTPYRVWVSEIMLQQTQVSVVVGYYERFMARFPALGVLADATLDDVLRLWTGLGYYSRARNLHRAAVLVRDRHGGTMPRDLDALLALPGIGRSTAGAILALSHGERHPILDGNVKRVLCRYHGVDGWPGQSRVERTLWTLAERHTPHERVAAYTQAVMDLGATLCVRSRPLCSLCPIGVDCVARREGVQARLPAPRPRRATPRRETAFLVLRDPGGALLLERRPPTGIWGGLWCFPECDPAADVAAICRSRYGVRPVAITGLAPIAHGFTHFRLDVYPVLVETGAAAAVAVADSGDMRWVSPGAVADIGLAAPVKRLIEALASWRIDPSSAMGDNRGTAVRFGEAAQMARTVQCIRLGEEAEGLDFPPLPGELGKRVFESVSKPAWQQWLAHQTMLINENRLKVTDPSARQFLEAELEKYFFGEGSVAPQGYVPPEAQ